MILFEIRLNDPSMNVLPFFSLFSYFSRRVQSEFQMTPAQTRVQISGAIETTPSQHGPQTLAGNCAIVPVSSRAVVTCWLNRVCGGPFGRLTDGDICCRTLPYPTIISNDEPPIWPEVLHTQEPIQNRGTPRRQRDALMNRQ